MLQTVTNNGNCGSSVTFCQQVEELKPGGKDILVTNHNHIEYIHLMADYRLNKQVYTSGGNNKQAYATGGACSQFHHLLKTVLFRLAWVGSASE